jgi:hypothetical protein
MEHEIAGGAILIQDDALLPQELYFESEPCVPGWKVVTDLTAPALDREIQKTGWTFFCSAGEIMTSAFGIDRTKMVRKAIETTLARKTSDRFNSLEILKVKFVKSKRFPLVQHLTLSARWRHIQQDIIPFSVRNVSNSICSRARPPIFRGTFSFAARKSLSSSFYSRQRYRRTPTATAEAVAQERADAHQRRRVRVQKEAEDAQALSRDEPKGVPSLDRYTATQWKADNCFKENLNASLLGEDRSARPYLSFGRPGFQRSGNSG